MSSSQQLAAVAAVQRSRLYYNHTQPNPQYIDGTPINIHYVIASATICGVLLLAYAACWQRKPSPDKPEEETQGVYTVSADSRLNQVADVNGPPPAYESVVDSRDHTKDCHVLQEVVTEPRPPLPARDGELPSYEAAVLLKDTKL